MKFPKTVLPFNIDDLSDVNFVDMYKVEPLFLMIKFENSKSKSCEKI